MPPVDPWITALVLVLAAMSPIISAVAAYWSARAKAAADRTHVCIGQRLDQVAAEVAVLTARLERLRVDHEPPSPPTSSSTV